MIATVKQKFSYPYVPLQTVVAHSNDNLSFRRKDGTLIPTQVDPVLDGTYSLKAVVTSVEIGEGLEVVEQTRELPEFKLHPSIEKLQFGMLVTVDAVDGIYSTTIQPDAEGFRQGPVCSSDSFSAVLRPETVGLKLPNFGTLMGTVTAWTGMPFAVVEMVHHTAEASAPIGESWFHSMTVSVPKGLVLVPLNEGPWTGGWHPSRPYDGRGDVPLIRRDVDPHTVRPQTVKLLRFLLVTESALGLVLGLMQQDGFVPAQGPAGFLESALGLDQAPLPQYPKAQLDALVLAEESRAEAFLLRVRKGWAHDKEGYSVVKGYRHPLGTRHGGETGGYEIEHHPNVPTLLLGYTNPGLMRRTFWHEVEGWMDRSGGFLTLHGKPFQFYQWRADNPGKKFNTAIGPNAPGESPNANWPSVNEDPFKFRTAPRNGVEGMGGADEEEQERRGAVDAQHAVREFGALRRLAEQGSRFAAMLVELVATKFIADVGDINPPVIEHQGFWGGRAHGWTSSIAALCYALFKDVNSMEYGHRYWVTLRDSQLPSGSFGLWNNPSNKEVVAAREASGIADLAIIQPYQNAIMSGGLNDLRCSGMFSPQDALDIVDALYDSAHCYLTVHRHPDMASSAYVAAVNSGNMWPETYAQTEKLYVSHDKSSWHTGFMLFLGMSFGEDGEFDRALELFCNGLDPKIALADKSRATNSEGLYSLLFNA